MVKTASGKEIEELKLKVEGLLFAYGDWLDVKKIMDSLSIDNDSIILDLLAETRKKFENGFSFIVEENENGEWRMVLKPEFEDVTTQLVTGTEIPSNILKVLSVIAYEMPVTKTRLAEILGKPVKSELDFLVKSKFLSFEKKGVGKYYKVTKKFYDYFKLDENTDFREKANSNINAKLDEPLSAEQISKMKKKES